MTDDDLDLLDANRLVDALARRFEIFVFGAAKDKMQVGDDNQIVIMRLSHDGDQLRAIGLCRMLESKISHEIREHWTDEDATVEP